MLTTFKKVCVFTISGPVHNELDSEEGFPYLQIKANNFFIFK